MTKLLNFRCYFSRALLAMVVLLGLCANPAQASDKWRFERSLVWSGSWATAGSFTGPFDAPVAPPNDQSIRHIVRISAPGEQVRIRLSNIYGTAPLAIGSVSVGLQDSGAVAQSGSIKAVTFGGQRQVVVAPGARIFSDPVDMPVAPLADLVISLYLPDGATSADSPVTTHVRALQTAYLSAGDQVDEISPSIDGTLTSYLYLTGVDVAHRNFRPVIAVLGDSIANGDESTLDANNRWPNLLAARLWSRGRGGGGRGPKASVLNLGISGNQVSQNLIGENAQARLDRDVLAQTGVTHLIVMEGINDIGLPPLFGGAQVSAATIIEGLRQIVLRAKAADLTVIAGTLTPSGGFFLPTYTSTVAEATRQEVNTWIRNSGTFDRVIDFDAKLRDPADPTKIRADLTADGLHPNDAGYQVMADAVRLYGF